MKRFESPKRPVRALLVLGLLFLGMDVFVVASMFGDEFAKVPALVKVGAITCIAIHTALGAVLVLLGFRRRRYVLEIGERGIRNPNRNPEWMPWDTVSSMRFRLASLSVVVAGDENSRPVRVGIELGLEYSRFTDALSEIAERSPRLQSEESNFSNRMAPTMIAPLVFSPVVYAVSNGSSAGLLLILFVFAVSGVGTILTVPKRLVVKPDAVHVEYLLKTSAIPFDQIDAIRLGLAEVVVRRRNKARGMVIRLGRNALSAFLALHRAREAAV